MNVKSILFLFVFFIASFSLDAQKDKTKKENPLKTKSISIFKNGTSFFIKEGKVKTKDGVYKMIDHLPRALFGTFWIHSPQQELKYVHSYSDEITNKYEYAAQSFKELLEANIRKKVKLHIGKEEIYEGKVEEVVLKDSEGEENSFIGNTIIVFKTATSWLSINPSEIRRVEFLEKPNQVLEKETSVQKNILSIDFTTKKSEQPLEMMYLQNGLNWTPTYLIELTSEKKAKLSLRAEVTNKAEDIENTDVNFVVGIPNFKYANKLSSLVDFLGMIHPNNNQYALQNFSNTISTSTITYESDESGFATGTPMGNGVEGDADEDLYFYKVKNLTLKNQGKGQYPIFSEEIDIVHIYETNLAQNGIHKGYYQKEFLFSPDNQNPVFHSIKVENNLAFPWTTGAAMVVSKKSGETRPISQDLLKYTPIKGFSYVKLTEAPDIKVQQAEKEIDRVERKKKMPGNNHYYYDLVTVEGKIKVKSYKDKKVDLNIKRAIHGELLKSNVKWLKAERINRHGDLNRVTDICWETSIDPGEELEIEYTYKVYVRGY